MSIELSKEIRQQLCESIKRYFEDEMDEPIGDLKAVLLLDYCVAEIGPSIYNKAIRDAQTYFNEKVASIDEVCYEPEFGYWKEKG